MRLGINSDMSVYFLPNVRDHRWLPVARLVPGEERAQAWSVTRVGVRWTALFGFILLNRPLTAQRPSKSLAKVLPQLSHLRGQEQPYIGHHDAAWNDDFLSSARVGSHDASRSESIPSL
jgi:hypothetical protein